MKRYILFMVIFCLVLPCIANSKIVKQLEIPYGKKNVNVYSFKINKYEINLLQQKTKPEDEYPFYKFSIKIYENKKEIYQELFKEEKVTEIYHLQINKKNYLLVQEWTGGAHCCLVWNLYGVDDKKFFKIIKINLGNYGGYADSDFFELDNNLFLKKGDDRFAYFGTSFAGSFFFDNYFLIKNNKLLPAYKYFIDEYKKNYNESLSDYNNFIKENEKQLAAKNDDLEEDLIVNSLALITYGYYTNKKDVFSILNNNKKIYDTYEMNLKEFYNNAINRLKKD